MAIADVAQTIAQHASTGPADKPGQVARNSLSPQFERLVQEVIRSHLIKETQAAAHAVAQEFMTLYATGRMATQTELAVLHAKITEIMQTIYK